MGLFTVHNQGGGVHIFSKHKSNMYTFEQPRGVSIFPLKHKSAMYTFVQQRGVGPKSQKYVQMYIRHTCMYMERNPLPFTRLLPSSQTTTSNNTRLLAT